MEKRAFGTGALIAGLLTLVLGVFAADRPNILFIAVDDLRPELGCYGVERVISPNIDRLAAEGVVFDQAYCQVPVCGASRASLMTGLYPTAQRFVTYYTKAQTDAAGLPDIPSWFRERGYLTIANGKIYHDGEDNADSWDDLFRPKDFKIYHKPENIALPDSEKPPFENADVSDMEYAGGPVMEKTINDLRRAKAEGKPFFIAAGFTKPHLPFNAPKKYWNLYDPAELELASNPDAPADAPEESIHQWGELRGMYGGVPEEGPVSDELAKNLIHGYLACVSYSDALIGEVLAELDRLDLREETIVVLWGDHGFQLGEHSLWCKHALFTTSLRAPLIISAPGKTAGARSAAQVEFVDLYPTLCELAGLEPPAHLQGESLALLLEDPSAEFKDAVFGRYHGGDAVKMGRYHYAEWSSGGRMLFDRERDPDENTNLANHPESAELVVKLSARLEAHRAKLRAAEPALRAAAGLAASDNSPPAWAQRTFQQKSALLDQPYTNYVNWRVTDLDGDDLVFAKVSGPDWLDVVNAKYGRIAGTPRAADLGENAFILSVTDGINPPVQARMELTVETADSVEVSQP